MHIAKLKHRTQTLIVRDINTPFAPNDRSSGQKLNREIVKLTDIMNQMGLVEFFALMSMKCLSQSLLFNFGLISILLYLE